MDIMNVISGPFRKFVNSVREEIRPHGRYTETHESVCTGRDPIRFRSFLACFLQSSTQGQDGQSDKADIGTAVESRTVIHAALTSSGRP
jgi:hypothetical protein